MLRVYYAKLRTDHRQRRVFKPKAPRKNRKKKGGSRSPAAGLQTDSRHFAAQQQSEAVAVTGGTSELPNIARTASTQVLLSSPAAVAPVVAAAPASSAAAAAPAPVGVIKIHTAP